MGDDLWYDMYNDEAEFYDDGGEDWDEEDDLEPAPSFHHMVQHCLIPTFKDVSLPMAKLFLCSAVIRFIITLGFIPRVIIHLLSIVAGIWLTHQFFQQASLYLFVFIISSYLLLKCNNILLGKYAGCWMAVFSVFYSLICELVIADEKQWHTVRGANIILVMKVISLAFDMDNRIQPSLPSLLPFFSYCSSPSSVIFGPWFTYADYLKMMNRTNSENLWWMVKFGKCLICSLFYFSISTCWSHWLFGFSNVEMFLPFLTKWITAYGDALSYRCSHYFVSYLSEGSMSIAGHSNELKVAEPLTVEFPRSLVEIVIYWNFPMHFWLKIYVFKVVKVYNVFLAILLTYAASALLHGLNFQLAAVLLSLGFHTYAEYEFRHKLSDIFSACVMARRCRNNCRHQFKSDHFLVMCTNLFFSLLALFHLTYLGVMFDSNPSMEEKGYEMSHTLGKWNELGYASHWLALFTFIFNLLL